MFTLATMIKSFSILLLAAIFTYSCNSSKPNIPTIGFVDAFEDETIKQAKIGFFKALLDSGFVVDSNLNVIDRNAQGDLPALSQIVDFFISKPVDLIASNTTLSTITAVQKTSTIPICMMVSPSTELAGLRGKDGKDPVNLFGVFETLEYIDTAFALIKEIFPKTTRVGILTNPSEPQSVEALKRIEANAKILGLTIITKPANTSAEVRQAALALLNEKIDVFFAMPDNVIFAAFETIVDVCNQQKVPIATSEAGLVKRGATIGFGADLYAWGYESGMQAAHFLKMGHQHQPTKLHLRRKMLNQTQAKKLNLVINNQGFELVN